MRGTARDGEAGQRRDGGEAGIGMTTVRFEVGEAEQVRRSRIMGGSGLQGIDGLGLSSSGSSTSRRRRLWFGLASASKFLRRGRVAPDPRRGSSTQQLWLCLPLLFFSLLLSSSSRTATRRLPRPPRPPASSCLWLRFLLFPFHLLLWFAPAAEDNPNGAAGQGVVADWGKIPQGADRAGRLAVWNL
jgi:hypothetical protein